jgi:hypothetical protein
MCISKMSRGGGGVYLEGDFDGEEKLIRRPDREIVEGGSAVGERVRRRKEERKERRKRGSAEQVCPPKGASLDGALLCPKGASEGGVLSSTVARSTCHVRTLGRQHCWRLLPIYGTNRSGALPSSPYTKNVSPKVYL